MDSDLHLIGDPHRVVARAAGVIGLLAVALIHLLDLHSKMNETPYLGVAYLGLIGASLVSAAMLLHGDNRKAWTIAGALSLATIAAYAVNRTVGMPSSTADIGNWLEPLGLASLFVEAITAAVSLYALSDVAAPQPARKR